nr:SDR family NAD(P)-dependent oxidoreductase [Paraflavitalea speifideiaquila]
MSRSILVTGGSGGIGSAIARRFATAGDRVAVHWFSGEQQAISVLENLPGAGHITVQGNLTEPDEVARIVEKLQGHSMVLMSW